MTEFADYDTGVYSFFQENRQRKFMSTYLRGRSRGMHEATVSDKNVREYVGVLGIGALITTDAKSQNETKRGGNPQIGARIWGSQMACEPGSLEHQNIQSEGA
jgi:hypothetical protein